MVREETTNLLDWYFQETGRVLPESWSFWGFCNQLLDFESTTEIQTNRFPFFVMWGAAVPAPPTRAQRRQGGRV